jgi:hypothetical protein
MTAAVGFLRREGRNERLRLRGGSLRRTAWRIALLVFASCVVSAAGAEVIAVRNAELTIEEGDLLLSTDFSVAFTPPLEEALEKGVALYFTLEFELSRSRKFWFDEKTAQWSTSYRVSYTSLTRQYRVAVGGQLGTTLETLEDVERYIGHVARRPVARADVLTSGARYEAAVRLRLDTSQLPKPFQVSALASKEWQLDSNWHTWAFTP